MNAIESMKKKTQHTTLIKVPYSIRGNIALVYLLLVIFPPGVIIYFYETGATVPGNSMWFVYPVFMAVVTIPVVKMIEYILVGRNLRKASIFCEEIRSGNYQTRFKLPNQKDEESAMISFLRDLELVADHIRGQNRQLMHALHATHDKAAHMQELATRDSLTGLYNRRYFDAVLAEEAEITCSRGEPLSLIMLDCDKFKQVNDMYGHAEGDRILKTLADTMQSVIRSDKDIAFRFGGDEFGIIMPGADIRISVRAASRLSSLYMENDVKGTSLSISVTSVHLSTSRSIEEQVERLISTTDKGIYTVKSQGGDGISKKVLSDS